MCVGPPSWRRRDPDTGGSSGIIDSAPRAGRAPRRAPRRGPRRGPRRRGHWGCGTRGASYHAGLTREMAHLAHLASACSTPRRAAASRTTASPGQCCTVAIVSRPRPRAGHGTRAPPPRAHREHPGKPGPRGNGGAVETHPAPTLRKNGPTHCTGESDPILRCKTSLTVS